MNQYEFDKLLEKYLAGECNPEQEKLILKWQDNMLKNSELHLSEQEKEVIQGRLWDNIRVNAFGESMAQSRFKVIPTWLKWSVAASILLVAARFWFMNVPKHTEPIVKSQSTQLPDGVEVKNTSANPQEITLEDGSSVVLKASSSISYPEHFGSKTRSVFLKGEAFFKVKKDPTKPFIVHAGELITEVLGTSFTIKSYEDAKAIEVLVATGRVSVYENTEKSANSHNGLILTPNQKITFYKESKKLISGIVENPVAIKPPATVTAFVFEETPLPDVLEKLRNAYGLEIVVENHNLNQCVFTADLNDLPLHTQLELICKSVNATYEQRGTGIFINGEGCK